MKSKQIIMIILILAMLFTGCISRTDSLRYDGQKRTYNIHLPASYDPSISYPLVIVLHGGGGNAENIEQVTGFSEKADEEGFIVVYPDGSGRFPKKLLTWNGGFCCGYALENNIDDVGFMRTLIEKMKDEYPIDPSMVYITGVSNGGIMSNRLGSELSDIVASIGPVIASIGGKATEESSLWAIPEPKYPISVISFNGMVDERVPYNGGQPTVNDTRGAFSYLSVNESISFWVNHNNCSTVPMRNVSESGNIIVDTYSNGFSGTEVVLYSIVNGGHAWPGGEKGSRKGDEPTQEISATDIIWDFFKNHPRNPNTEIRYMNHDGINRSYRIHIPANINRVNALLLVLHGGSGNAKHTEEELTKKGFNILSEKNDFVVVYPNGINHRWNDGRTENNSVIDVDDVGFLTKIIDTVSSEFDLNPERVFSTGISNGGQMSYRLAFEKTDKIAAIAPVVSSIHEALYYNSSPSEPISVFLIAGTDDPLVPYDGGNIVFLNKQYGTVVSMNETVQFWVNHNNCSKNPVITTLPDMDPTDNCIVTTEEYSNGNNNTTVLFYSIDGGGHTWPSGGEYFTESLVGKICYDFNACEHIWDFFSGINEKKI